MYARKFSLTSDIQRVQQILHMSIGVNLRVTGHTSIGGRKYQEDYFSVAYQQTENDQNLEYAYFGIYDGHGGAEASLYAKEHLMNTIVSQKLFWSENDDDVLKSIREGYIQTHYSMWREQGKQRRRQLILPPFPAALSCVKVLVFSFFCGGGSLYDVGGLSLI